ncbi:MAG: penicillin-binding transpeptidase domain-containing protein [Candidatus Levyibacteriota bacterium]
MKHGFAFGDHIKTEKFKRRKYEEDAKPLRTRWYLFPALIIILGGILFFNLFAVQIIQGSYYQQLSDSNRIRTQIIHAPRGVIFDRHSNPLVYNTPGFRLTQNCDPNDTTTKCKTTHLTQDQALPLIAKGDKNVEVDSLRQYPYKDVLSHVIGYIGQISQNELKSGQYEGYARNEWIGKSGIEEQYQQMLRGQDGKQLIEVNALGEKVRALGETDPIPGRDVTLTLDLKLQQATFKAAKDIQKGVVIVSKPDGEILAMVSKPSFDANLFTLDASYKPATDSAYPTVGAMLTDGQNQPLLNRAIDGVYPPGSTFKIVAAAAGLQDRIIDENYKVEDTGILQIGDFSFANWYYTEYGRKEPNPLNVVTALSRSNDIFFYKLAEKIGVDKLSGVAAKMGVGQVLGIDLPGESSGVLPTKQWKKENIKEDWYLGDTYHYGIGQGYLLTTPLQVNAWTQVVANSGTLYQPHLVMSQSPIVKNTNVLDAKTIDLIRQGMIQGCSTGGVAWPLFNYQVKNPHLQIDGKNITSVASASADMRGVSVACKTGTAQHGGEDTLPHSWITLYAPAYKPQVVVTVLKESAGEGSNEAGPVAKEILDAYFGKN